MSDSDRDPDFQAQSVEHASDLGDFVAKLTLESERVAVIVASARIDLALEKMLSGEMRPSPGGRDALFDTEGILGSLGAKITIAHRLNLIDDDFEHALQMIRKIRNDFAHSMESESLSSQRNHNRLLEATRSARRAERWSVYEEHFKQFPVSQDLKDFGVLIVMSLIALEASTYRGPLLHCRKTIRLIY